MPESIEVTVPEPTQESTRGRAPSIRDVAHLAASRTRRSRACSHHPSIRPETKQRVLDVMAGLQYKPNRAARALVTSRSRTIGILSASSTTARVEHRRDRVGRPRVRLLGEHREHRVG